jgi:hypothetical protein
MHVVHVFFAPRHQLGCVVNGRWLMPSGKAVLAFSGICELSTTDRVRRNNIDVYVLMSYGLIRRQTSTGANDHPLKGFINDLAQYVADQSMCFLNARRTFGRNL